MALESATYTSDLVVTNPTGSDPLAFADDHIRLIKSAVKATFPNISGAVTKTHAEINALASQTDLTTLQTTLTAAIATAIADSKNVTHPVGSIYINASNATNPATLLGFGTWTAFGAGRVPVGFNAADPLFDTAEETGGSKDASVVSHTHTATSTVTDPGHTHQIAFQNVGDAFGGTRAVSQISGGDRKDTLSATTGITVATSLDTVGSSGTNANLQPYITVYMWKRTA